jgi:hypothetical protein
LGNSLRTALLLLHGLLAVALLGAITHQAFARPVGQRRSTSFVARYRGVGAGTYSSIVIVLFVLTTILGALLYPSYRTLVRPALEMADLRAANGSFEVKEHLAALGLLMLPAYYAAWSGIDPHFEPVRRILTWLLAAIVWWNFLAGQVLNNIRGLFA